MGLQAVPAYISQNAFQHPAELDRNLVEAIFRRTGAVKYGDFSVAIVPGQLAVRMSAGNAVILGTEPNAQQGAYFAWSDADEDVPLPAPSGSPRIDSLLMRVLDPQYGTITGDPRVEWAVVAGVPAASPTVRPDSDFNLGGTFYEPGAWWRVLNVRVDPTDTEVNPANITNLIRYVSMNGVTLVKTAAERNALTALPGDRAIVLDQGIEWTYHQIGAWAGWVPPAGTLVFSADHTTTINLTTGSYGSITLQTELRDLLGTFTPGGAVYTPNVPGWYIFEGGPSFSANATGIRAMGWQKNGAVENGTTVSQPAVSGESTVMTARSHPVYMNGTTDGVELIARQTSGSTIATNATTTQRAGVRVTYAGP